MPMMYILHVSDCNSNESKPTRVVVGCKSLANRLDEDLRLLGYNVWTTYGEAPERSPEEIQQAMVYTTEAMNSK